ncbi:energy transducer TonB [Flavobacterium sp.]|uniref:energy transducer TonB n=1 Tax=Flavobacterium sp. TaxID=239 RepID=UPI00262BE550|nr:energy transducer TonB [Flavobacterium sp.]MDG2431262.1 energy transducer TonB [Flavobacterium sp.]
MSKLSLYENNWINLVFENRNQEYGAFQLRQQSTKTSLIALFMGVLLCASLASLPHVISTIFPDKIIPDVLPQITDKIIEVTKIYPTEVKPVVPIAPKPLQAQPAAVVTTKQLTNPVIVKAPLATQDVPKNTEIIANPSTATTGSSTGTGISTPQVTSGSGTAPVDYGNTVVTSAALDKLPEFPGGIGKFYTFVGRNFESPEVVSDKNIKIYVSFVVEKDGSMTDIQVKNDPGYGLAKEAIRVLKSLKTKWLPGMIDSKPVRTAYNLPITVQVN